MQAPGERPPALGQVVAARAEQVQVRGKLHRTGEQFPGQRLRPVQPTLQQHLLPHAAALAEEFPFHERLVRGTRGESFGEHELSVEERPQYPVGHQEVRPLQHGTPVGYRLPAGIEPVKLGLEHRAVGGLVRKEELELELVSEPHRLIPPAARRAEQDQLRHRPVDEMVDGAVPVERRDQVLAPFDGVNRLLPARVDGDHILLGQGAEHPLHPGAGVQDLPRVRQSPLGQVTAQRLQNSADLTQSQRAVTNPQQRQRHQCRCGHRGNPVDPDSYLERHFLQR